MNRKITSRETLLETAKRIAEQFEPERVILFGSHARGEADHGSDVDLMVLFSQLGDPRQRAAEIHNLLAGCGFPMDIVVSTISRFERYRNVPNTVYWPASREGQVLYERPDRIV
jgi:predicted nucleotidyltransferase